MTRKFTISIVLIIFAFAFGCDKIGITKSAEEEKRPQLMDRILENDKTATILQKQLTDLEAENSRLSIIINENDATIKSLQGQLASAEALVQNMQTEIKSAKKTKTILSVVAVISLIFNALFLWIIFGSKKREPRLALPPAREESKKDIDIMKYSPTSPSGTKEAESSNKDSIKKAQMASGKAATSVSAEQPPVKKQAAKKPADKPVAKKMAPKKQNEPKNDNNK